ncbi:MAG: type II toxin-antitoxin system RelE/ParE family toxin [Rickettsiales bacterium]
MLKIDIYPKAKKFIAKIPNKHARQILTKIYQLQTNPKLQDSKQLQGYDNVYLRTDSGEYRIIYRYTEDILYIILIGKRNDDEVYKKLKRL